MPGTRMTPIRSKPALATLWDAGRYRYARWQASPNFGPRPKDSLIDLVLIHSISLPPGEFGGGHVQRLFANQLDHQAHVYFRHLEGLQVSAHFFIGRDGALWQFVHGQDRAWHAGESIFQGRANCNDRSIGIELEGLEGGRFEAAQYETLTSLCATLIEEFAIAHFAGHEHVAPGRKKDPGSGFDWQLLQQALGLSDDYFRAIRG